MEFRETQIINVRVISAGRNMPGEEIPNPLACMACCAASRLGAVNCVGMGELSMCRIANTMTPPVSLTGGLVLVKAFKPGLQAVATDGEPMIIVRKYVVVA